MLLVIAYSGRLRPKGVGILLVEVYERVEKSVIWVRERAQRAEQMNGFIKAGTEALFFLIDSSLNDNAFTTVLKGMQRSKRRM